MTCRASVFRAGLVVIGGLILAGHASNAGSAARERPPIALALIGPATGLALQDDGTVVAFDAHSTHPRRSVYKIAAGYQVIDLVATTVRGTVLTVIPAFLRTSQQSQSVVFHGRLGPSMAQLRLQGPGLYIGAAIDPASGDAYIANSLTREIFRFRVGDLKARPVFVTSVKRATRIGPMVYDPSGRQLILTDLDQSALYTVNLASMQVTRIMALSAAEIRGLAWDAVRRVVHLADSSKETIWSIDMGTAPPQERVLAHIPKLFQDPAAVAVGPDGRLWVADQGARAVFRLTPDGSAADITVGW